MKKIKQFGVITCMLIFAGSVWAAPAVPVKVSPIGGATTDANPLLDWNASSGADYYGVWLATAGNPSFNVLNNAAKPKWLSAASTQLQVNGLAPGNYVWWVKATSDTTGKSTFGAKASFTVGDASDMVTISIPPSAYHPEDPANYTPDYNYGQVDTDTTMHIPLVLPDGVTIYEIKLYYQDLVTPGTFYLDQTSNADSDDTNTIADVSPAADATPGTVTLSDPAGLVTVDNTTYFLNIGDFEVGAGTTLLNTTVTYGK